MELKGYGLAREIRELYKVPSLLEWGSFCSFPFPDEMFFLLLIKLQNKTKNLHGWNFTKQTKAYIKFHTTVHILKSLASVPPLQWCHPVTPTKELFQCLELCSQARCYASLIDSVPGNSEGSQFLFALFPLPCKYIDMKKWLYFTNYIKFHQGRKACL